MTEKHSFEAPSLSETKKMKRRDILKGLVGVPVLGLFAHQLFKKKKSSQLKKDAILSELGISEKDKPLESPAIVHQKGDLIRLGIVGFGARGTQLARSAGFAHPAWIESMKQAALKNKLDKRLEDWLNQEDLNVAITGICDVFDSRAEEGLQTANNAFGPGGDSRKILGAKRFRTYHDMLNSSEVDAVIVTTPDFHHAQMTIDAVEAGKHVYVEKCLTRTEEELCRVADAVKSHPNSIFQLGHQYTKNTTFAKAKEMVEKNILGKITLVETTTNRNSQWGAYIRHLDGNGNPLPGDPSTIDWNQWLGSRPKVPFSIDRYYNWTKWWDYATGLSGQLFSHEYDAVNQILDVGIPKSAMASGGIYFYKDNREIPDTFQVVFEFPNSDLTLVYSASLSSSRSRGRVFMGHDASMEVGNNLTVTVDGSSTRFRDKLRGGMIDPSLPLFTFRPGAEGIDAVTSATEKYYATRGLMYTYRDGKRLDVNHLHVKEWLDCIRFGGMPASNIEKGFEVTIACHMATKSYREKRRVEWDPVRKRIV